ncbi:MAG: cyclic nucleotide-binding domain-containing protein [Acidimicrobiales bacterium]
MTSPLLQRCQGLPVLELAEGETLVTEGGRTGRLFVVVDGTFEVSFAGSRIAMITEAGTPIAEMSILLDTPHGATVTAARPSKVHVVEDAAEFLLSDREILLEISRVLARRLNRLVGYLADVKAQYGGEDGHLGLVDEVLSQLTFGEQATVEPGSERDPDPLY